MISIQPRDRVAPEQFLHAGHVIVAARGGRNTAAAYDLPFSNAIVGTQFFVLEVDPAVDPHFVAWFLRSERIRRYFDTRRKGSHVQLIQLTDLAEIDVPLPPLDVQRKLVEFARLTAEERALSARLADLRSRYFDELLHHRAFAGHSS
ncbi:MAG: hypothetical protein KF715_11950 [Candidatus Didemnitutus sp.]|nr:hypothetical protein [Candidatus Didemnitutus sp.]